jgi:deazaflavin-dependent oxidoreductase (nitroreductase family)
MSDPAIAALDGEYEPSPSEQIRCQVADYENSDGTKGATLEGFPVVILTSIGAKSGRVRKNPVMRIVDGERYIAVASAAGRPENPSWYHNVVAHPVVRLQDGASVRNYRAREVHDAEKDHFRSVADCAYPRFPQFRRQAGREIPIIVFEPTNVD